MGIANLFSSGVAPEPSLADVLSVNDSSTALMVGLIRKYSNQDTLTRFSQAVEQAKANRRKPGKKPQVTPTFKVTRRLSADTIAELVEAYRRGTSTLELQKRYHLGKGTVLKLLADQGVPMRQQQHLTESQIDKAVEQYQAGDSLATVAKQVGSTATTVRRVLNERGVAMRPSGGGRRRRTGR
ncbi:helix-turn-helix domain-containing protein [Nocardia bovistercoris]|uniref:Helix-turn-helix domain-containing protein n=1 Tax=Nocardia bovistercoris TaxID=2785916 RepID=A0A931IK97_9NOCA|nr:helix-turn-helix domain-containing protein [Nocardia bovistercoris]MBH0781876.1 helix-turn-helix domain-containing protein [Nocardia bovistercoris]